MIAETIQDVTTKMFQDDTDILRFAREENQRIKLNSYFFNLIYSKVEKVGKGFYIDGNLRITVASLGHLYKHNIKEDEVIADVIKGALAHENAHAMLFPFMTRARLTETIVEEYAKSRNVKFHSRLFNKIENYISDIFNELVLYVNKHENYQYLPKLRYYYIYKPHEEEIKSFQSNPLKRLEGESNPVYSLFMVHNIVFASTYLSNSKRLVLPENPKWISEHLYLTLHDMAVDLNELLLREHISRYVSGGFAHTIRQLVKERYLFRATDEFYELLESRISTGSVMMSEDEFKPFRKILNRFSGLDGFYWKYYIVLSALYRYVVEHNIRESDLPENIDEKEQSCPRNKSSEDEDNEDEGGGGLDLSLNDILGSDTELLSPKVAEYLAKKLLRIALLTEKQTIMYTTTSDTAVIPWYKNPRGRIDKLSLSRESYLDWKVQVPIEIPDYKKTTESVAGVPDNITIVIDESGSTLSETAVLAPLYGGDTKVFDVERVTIMSLLYNVMKYTTETKTNLVRFSDEVIVEEGKITDIYNWLKNVKASDLQWGGTEITKGVLEAVAKKHKDSPYNYFILATDMQISDYDANEIAEIFKKQIRLSPILILSIGYDLPSPIKALNRYRNVAAVSVTGMNDYPKIEEAIRKLATVIKRR